MIRCIRVNKVVEQKRGLYIALGILCARQIVFFSKGVGPCIADINDKYVFPMTDGFSDETKAGPNEQRGTNYQAAIVLTN